MALQKTSSSDRSGNVFLECLSRVPHASRYLIALSGGVDSVLLLSLAVPFFKERDADVLAIHVNHGLSPNADNWQAHCEALCAELGVGCLVERVQVETAGQGIEAAARKVRYGAIEKHLDSSTVVLLGHHENDQLETVLMRALKGADPRLLAGMPVHRKLGAGLMFRPWLSISRDNIEKRATELNLSWIEDESNLDTKFERNQVRHHSLPDLEKLYSEGSDERTARQVLLSLSEAAKLWVACESRLYEQARPLIFRLGYGGLPVLTLDHIKHFPKDVLSQCLRLVIADLQMAQPSEAILQRAKPELVDAGSDSQGLLQWQGGAIMRYADSLFFFNQNPLLLNESRGLGEVDLGYRDAFLSHSVDESVSLVQLLDVIPDRRIELYWLSIESFPKIMDRLSELDNVIFLGSVANHFNSSIFRQRLPGDRIFGVSLKDYWRELELPAQWRQAQPLLLLDGELQWAGWDLERYSIHHKPPATTKSVIWLKSVER